MAEPEPTYSFSIPSIDDDTPIDCRIYHPKTLQKTLRDTKARGNVKAAVIAHPYAPLGGCFDDPVVLSVSETLLDEGFVVGTFNFRGAAGSAGRTSWTGRAEQVDYMSFTGFLLNYVQNLLPIRDSSSAEHMSPSIYQIETGKELPASAEPQRDGNIDLLLAGYSYGSLILARLPSISQIIQSFQDAEKGTSAAEIVLRASALAGETKRGIEATQSPTSPRGRQLMPDDAATSPTRRTGASPIMVGGEETDPSMRRRSRDSRRSMDFMRKSMEKVHIKRHSMPKSTHSDEKEANSTTSSRQQPAHGISVRYLVISPVLLPFTHSLCPPGPPSMGLSLGKQAGSSSSGLLFLENPTLGIFGSKDVFTSSNRLRRWAEKQSTASNSTFQWQEIQGAGHFWREDGVMQALQQRVIAWMNASST